MSRQPGIANSIIDYALTGGTAHVATRTVFDGLDGSTAGARVDRSPHALFQLLNHMILWQDGVLEWLDGGSPSMPEHASESWPGPEAPSSRAEWVRAVRRFRTDLTRLEQAAKNAVAARKGRDKSPLEMLVGIAAHNSYHAGQAVVLRPARLIPSPDRRGDELSLASVKPSYKAAGLGIAEMRILHLLTLEDGI